MRLISAVAVALAMAISGCAELPPGPRMDASGVPPTIVAVIDTGINPYHEAVRSIDPVDSVGLARELSLQVVEAPPLADSGTFAERVQADAAFWENVERGMLYAFPGTRVMGLWVEPDPDDGSRLLDLNGHGTSTASVVLAGDPNALVVAIQVSSNYCTTEGDATCLLSPSVADAMEWIAEQPWIDVVSISMGLPGGLPDSSVAHPEVGRFLSAAERAHASGKLLVSSAGNDPPPSTTDYVSGPPWMIAAGFTDDRQHGRKYDTASTFDVGANGTQITPRPQSVDEYRLSFGTSFSAPFVAGTLARAVSELRQLVTPAVPRSHGLLVEGTRDGGEIVSIDRTCLRMALNASAEYWAVAEWNPTHARWFNETDPTNKTIDVYASVTAPPTGPGSLGWGHVGNATYAQVRDRCLSGDLSIPDEKAETSLYMERYAAARESYWASIPR